MYLGHNDICPHDGNDGGYLSCGEERTEMGDYIFTTDREQNKDGI